MSSRTGISCSSTISTFSWMLKSISLTGLLLAYSSRRAALPERSSSLSSLSKTNSHIRNGSSVRSIAVSLLAYTLSRMSLGSPERESEVSRLSFRCSSVNSAQSATVSSVSWFLRHPAGRGCRARRHAGRSVGLRLCKRFPAWAIPTNRGRSGRTLQVQYRHFGRFAQIQFRYPGAVQAKVRQLAQLVESEGGYRILAEVQGPEICQSFYRCGIRDAMEFQVEGFQRSEVLQPVQTFTVLASVASSA